MRLTGTVANGGCGVISTFREADYVVTSARLDNLLGLGIFARISALLICRALTPRGSRGASR